MTVPAYEEGLSSILKPDVQAGVKLGRLTDGNQRDRGTVIHALPTDIPNYGYGKAFCGTLPGKRSIGWWTDFHTTSQINCKRCLKAVGWVGGD